MSKKTATVIVAKREGGFKGWFHGGKFWAEGKTTAELTEAEMNGLAARPGIVVLVDGDQWEPTEATAGTATTTMELSADEAKALAEYRTFRKGQAERTAASQAAEARASATPPQDEPPETTKPTEEPKPEAPKPAEPTPTPSRQESRSHGHRR